MPSLCFCGRSKRILRKKCPRCKRIDKNKKAVERKKNSDKIIKEYKDKGWW
jgi:phage FluMu protein Com